MELLRVDVPLRNISDILLRNGRICPLNYNFRCKLCKHDELNKQTAEGSPYSSIGLTVTVHKLVGNKTKQ